MRADPIETLDWHWDEPLWPVASFHGTAADVARLTTVRRCFWCGAEFLAGDEILRAHSDAVHRGQPLTFTVYPPTFGIVPKGRDA
jgi:hypothetical protein